MDKSLSRRKYKRHTVPENAFILYNGRVGQIIDLSESGMTINISSSRKPLPENKDGIFYSRSTIKAIDKLRLRIVHSDDIKLNGFGNCASQTIGVKFEDLDVNQQKQIRQHISEQFP